MTGRHLDLRGSLNFLEEYRTDASPKDAERHSYIFVQTYYRLVTRYRYISPDQN